MQEKMILIPEESINNLHQCLSRDNVTTMQTPGKSTSRLDKEMSKIINSTSIQDNREKYAMYQQAFERFMYVRDCSTRSVRQMASAKRNLQ